MNEEANAPRLGLAIPEIAIQSPYLIPYFPIRYSKADLEIPSNFAA